MRRILRCTIPACLLLVLGILWCCVNPVPEREGLEALLPDEVGGWMKHGAAQGYAGDDLFTYINGGAEIYREFGFEEVVVQDYRTDQGGAISLEVYKMTGPESAYGIFTFKRSADGRAMDYHGAEAQLEDYYLNLWKGSYLVTLTGFDEEDTTIQGLQDLARSLAFRITEIGEAPGLVSLLPDKDKILGSVRYFNGPLALFNSHSFAREDVFSLDQGVRGDYTGGESLFIFAYETPEGAEAAFRGAEEFFASAPDHAVDRGPGEDCFRMQGPREGFFQLKRVQDFILVLKELGPSESPSPLLVEAQARIDGKRSSRPAGPGIHAPWF